ncbi:MAG: MBL fold metallo-hydrolase [Acidobacteria bacterium]|nr:MBL fold metallo-hydrolase [Acidobacteriota bacterium]
MIDTGRHRAHTEAILDFARQQRQPIRAVINTHWHLDHVGGNVLLRDSVRGLQVHASSAIDGALEGFLANYHSQLKEIIPRSDPEARTRYEAELAPYRRAFGSFLDCGASDATKQSCAAGWIMELGAMLPESEHAFTRRLMDYYVEALRSDPGMAGRCRPAT